MMHLMDEKSCNYAIKIIRAFVRSPFLSQRSEKKIAILTSALRPLTLLHVK